MFALLLEWWSAVSAWVLSRPSHLQAPCLSAPAAAVDVVLLTCTLPTVIVYCCFLVFACMIVALTVIMLLILFGGDMNVVHLG